MSATRFESTSGGERRPSMQRTRSWPSNSSHSLASGTAINMSTNGSHSAPERTRPPIEQITEDINHEPQSHFLSPMNDCDDFYSSYTPSDSDDDDSGSEVEWSAGIMDFALFDNDRRRVQETNERLPSKWYSLLSSQAFALQRSEQRNRRHSATQVPGLTPDTSPRLRDDLELDEEFDSPVARPNIPTITVTSPDGHPASKTVRKLRPLLPAIIDEDEEESDDEISDDEDEDLSFFITHPRRTQSPPQKRKLMRPGLRGSRTLSGQHHAWVRPPVNLYPLGERPEEERKAEMGCAMKERKLW